MRRMLMSLMLLLSGLSVAAAGEPGEVVTLSVPGMTRPVCPITVHKALTQLPGVLEAKVDYDSRSARVRFDPAQVDVTQLRQATADAGYPSEPITPPPAAGQ